MAFVTRTSINFRFEGALTIFIQELKCCRGCFKWFIGVVSLFVRKPYFTKEVKDCKGCKKAIILLKEYAEI